MNILLVQPFIIPEIETLTGKLMYSVFRKISFFDTYLNLQIIAAVTPKEHNIKFIDERFEDIKYEKKYDLIGLTCTTGLSKRAYEIADNFRKMNIPVVIGGPHVSFLPEEAKQHANAIVIGEGELIWPKLLKDLENGELKPFYKQEKTVNPAQIPPARRDIIKRGFLPVARIQATRGCRLNCEFCCVPIIEKKTIRKRPIDEVINELKSIRQKLIIFSDASLTMDPEYTKNLFRRMKGLHKKFACFGNTDVLAKDEELLKLAKKAGCHTWHVGFESTSQLVINKLNKYTNTIEEYKTVVKNIHKNGMAVSGAFIVGFDEDNKDTFKHILQTAIDIKIDLLEINLLTPFPGTPLYNRLNKEGRILTKDWFHYREGQGLTKTVYQPKNMEPEALRNGVDWIFWKWLAPKNQIRLMISAIRYGLFTFLYINFSAHFFL